MQEELTFGTLSSPESKWIMQAPPNTPSPGLAAALETILQQPTRYLSFKDMLKLRFVSKAVQSVINSRILKARVPTNKVHDFCMAFQRWHPAWPLQHVKLHLGWPMDETDIHEYLKQFTSLKIPNLKILEVDQVDATVAHTLTQGDWKHLSSLLLAVKIYSDEISIWDAAIASFSNVNWPLKSVTITHLAENGCISTAALVALAIANCF